ncbi:hypothetical protein D9M68_970040 [compost metagenome]
MPHARVVQALAGVALAEFGEIEAGAEVVAAAVDDGGAHTVRHGLEHVADGQDQAIIERVALGGAVERDDSDFAGCALQAQGDVGGMDGHVGCRRRPLVRGFCA